MDSILSRNPPSESRQIIVRYVNVVYRRDTRKMRGGNRMMLAAPSSIKVGSENRSVGVVHLKAKLALMQFSSFLIKVYIIYIYNAFQIFKLQEK